MGDRLNKLGRHKGWVGQSEVGAESTVAMLGSALAEPAKPPPREKKEEKKQTPKGWIVVWARSTLASGARRDPYTVVAVYSVARRSAGRAVALRVSIVATFAAGVVVLIAVFAAVVFAFASVVIRINHVVVGIMITVAVRLL